MSLTVSTKPGGLWWRGLDSNQRTLCGQIYSLLPLTTRPPLHRASPHGSANGGAEYRHPGEEVKHARCEKRHLDRAGPTAQRTAMTRTPQTRPPRAPDAGSRQGPRGPAQRGPHPQGGGGRPPAVRPPAREPDRYLYGVHAAVAAILN